MVFDWYEIIGDGIFKAVCFSHDDVKSSDQRRMCHGGVTWTNRIEVSGIVQGQDVNLADVL